MAAGVTGQEREAQPSAGLRPIRVWLLGCCCLVFAMAVIGAITRLTESGLSITEWKPVTGALPPLSQAQWQDAFDRYRQSPEFRARHFWMELRDFRHIFFWEWLHRLVGRLIGLAYALPLVFFALSRRIPKGYGGKLAGILALGALQGAVGWWMVESGLADRPSVSHFRLAVHLALALLIFSAMLWVALDCGAEARRAPAGKKGLIPHGWLALALLATTIVFGAFVAGLHAGLIDNTFPLMDGRFTPPGVFDPLQDRGWVQFTHRWLAITTGITVLSFAWRVRDRALGVMVLVQVGLGISTLLSVVFLPLAALHQAGAIVLLGLLLRAVHAARRAKSFVYGPALAG